jgi:hypothetical protein
MRVLLPLLLVGIVGCGAKEAEFESGMDDARMEEYLNSEQFDREIEEMNSPSGQRESDRAYTEYMKKVPRPLRPLVRLGAVFKRNEQGKIVEVDFTDDIFGDLTQDEIVEVDFTNDIFGDLTDAGLVHLKALTNLQKLDLSVSKITDATLVHLKGLTKLQVLTLGETQITDAGLVHLKGLNDLEVLELDNTKVTDAGVAELQKALPNCKITK